DDGARVGVSEDPAGVAQVRRDRPGGVDALAEGPGERHSYGTADLGRISVHGRGRVGITQLAAGVAQDSTDPARPVDRPARVDPLDDARADVRQDSGPRRRAADLRVHAGEVVDVPAVEV